MDINRLISGGWPRENLFQKAEMISKRIFMGMKSIYRLFFKLTTISCGGILKNINCISVSLIFLLKNYFILTMTLSPALQSVINSVKSVKRMILTITEIAEKLGVHEQTLRNWERLGLLKVSRIGGNRTRIYDDNDLQLCRKIASFSDQGINLRGIKALLALEKTEKLN